MIRPANEEMIQGFRDGYDRNSPEPSGNRSHSYRHGFKAGRNDILPMDEGPFAGMDTQEIEDLADEAMNLDEAEGASS
jgi:hypothetical protein